MTHLLIESDEVAFFRQVHKLPTPTNPEEAQRLTHEDIDYFRRVHKLGTPQSSQVKSHIASSVDPRDLSEDEKRYFKQVHMIPHEILEQSVSQNA